MAFEKVFPCTGETYHGHFTGTLTRHSQGNEGEPQEPKETTRIDICSTCGKGIRTK